jgi:GT2 family glycosyltransferase
MHPDLSGGAVPKVAIVAIGRNEGERLKLCLRAALRDAPNVIYVDSGSSDGSAEYARSVGCRVVELDASRPFSAARARNEGFASLMEYVPATSFVQFVDGDCELEEGWLERAARTLEARADAGVVCGQVREIHPEASVFNRICNLEWRQPAGEVRTAGGRFMTRARVYREVGGFRPDVIAAEDDEFAIRVRAQGWKILVIDAPMASHDAAITKFGQWWQRNRRAGHGYAQVAALHGSGEEHYFVRDRRRILIWGLALPIAALAAAPFTRGISLVVLLCLYALQYLHIVRGCLKRGWASRDAWPYGFFTVISRFPTLQGLLEYYGRRMRRRTMTIIEYK